MTARWIKQNWHRVLAHIVGLAPTALFALDYLRDDVGALLNRELMLRSGSAGLLMLVASLACTPLNILLGWRQAVQMRRPLGLYGFFYTTLHLLAYAVLDNLLDFVLIWRDVGERRSMVVGFVAFLRCCRWRSPRRAAGSSGSAVAGGRSIAWSTWRCRSACCTTSGWTAILSACR